MNDWKSRATFTVALVLFFGSGAVSLVYQTLWVSWWVHVFGGSTYAISTVLAAFMAGLGLGSWLLGRVADRKFDRMVGYGLLEIAIGAYALLLGGIERIGLPKITDLIQPLYAAIYNYDPDAKVLLIVVRFVISFLVLLPVTTMMGATLPMLSKHLVGTIAGVGSRVGTLYSWNTYGAVAGTLLAGFFLIENWGRHQTNTYMAAANLLIGAVALIWSVFFSEDDKPASAATSPDEPAKAPIAAAEPDAGAELTPFWTWVMLACFGVSGAVAMVYEVAWSRLTGLILGSSVYSFTVMLATFLIGIAAGSAWAGNKLRDRKAGLLEFALVQLGIGGSTAMIVWLGEYLPVLSLWIQPLRDLVNREHLVLTYVHNQMVGMLVCVAMMIVPALLLGACFPVVVQVYSRNVATLGRSIGVVYGSNTLGAIFGSIAGGFLLMPLLGLYWTMAVACIVNLVLAAVLAVGAARRPSRAWGTWPAAVTAGVALGGAVLMSMSQAWDPLVMNFGVFQYDTVRYRNIVTADGLLGFASGLRRLKDDLGSNYQLLYVRDGINSTVTVMCSPEMTRRKLAEDAAAWPTGRLEPLRTALRDAAQRRRDELVARLPADGRDAPTAALPIDREFAETVRLIDEADGPELVRQLRMVISGVRWKARPAGDAPDWESQELEVDCDLRLKNELRTVGRATVTGTRAELCSSRHLRNNGKVDASDVGDMATQLMLAYVPLLAHPDPADVCVIGLGSGTTAGAVEQFSAVKSLDCVELEPAVHEAARSNFAHRHRDYAADPLGVRFHGAGRFRLFEQDGRNHLAMYDKSYDVIISEPSNPWIAGVANLFTVEFYAAAKKRLKPGGVLCQWLQLYSTDWPDYLMVLRSMREEFKHVYVFRVDPADSSDTMVLASDEELIFDPLRMQKVIDDPAHAELRTGLTEYLNTDVLSLLHSVYVLGGSDVNALLDAWAARGRDQGERQYLRVNRDDRPLLEYSAPRVLFHSNNQLEILSALWSRRTRGRAVDSVLRTRDTDWPKCADFDGAVKAADQSRLAASLFRTARRYIDSEDFGEAGDALEDLLRLRPLSMAGHYQLADVLARRRGNLFRSDDARRHLASAAAGVVDDWLLKPPGDAAYDTDRVEQAFQERLDIAGRLTRELPASVSAYVLMAETLRNAPDGPRSGKQIAECERRAAEVLLSADGVPPHADDAAIRERLRTLLLRRAFEDPVRDGPVFLAALARLHSGK
jgi:predicted membrane-bound spermidine synthase